jgi:hypothetical protein
METSPQRRAPIGAAIRRFLMKRIVLAAITCLSLLVALPAISAAHSSGQHAGRDHRPDDHGGQRHRPGDRHRDREGRDRLEHFGAQAAVTAGVVRSFQNGVLTITLPDGSTVAGTVTAATRVSCEGMDRDFSARDGGSSGSGDNGGRGDDGDQGDGDRGDRHNDLSCVAMLHQPGTSVRHAELHVFRGAAVWEEVELGL